MNKVIFVKCIKYVKKCNMKSVRNTNLLTNILKLFIII